MTASILRLMLPTDECFIQEVPEPVYDGLGCISDDYKLDLVIMQCNLTGDQYIRDVLQPVVVPHFDNHPLATRPVYMDDNARPHRSRAVTAVPGVTPTCLDDGLNPASHPSS
jgi:hypothetical protein